MTTNELTREQVEELRAFYYSGTNAGINGSLQKLCDMALAYLDQKPVEPNNAMFYGMPSEEEAA